MAIRIRQRAQSALMLCEPDEKIAALVQLSAQCANTTSLDCILDGVERIETPGRPAAPVLVEPHEVPRRKLGSEDGRLAQFHAFAHIEFNAINLALDAIYRFAGMPEDYYRDWLQVAREEGEHFTLLRDHLAQRGVNYGDYPAHNNLWQMALDTDHDVLVRMALVPRVLEARGLDVTPKIIAKLKQLNAPEAIIILERIYRDEIGHVAIGNRWFAYACKKRGVQPQATFTDLLQRYTRGFLAGPFNETARIEAGFSREELDTLKLLVAQRD